MAFFNFHKRQMRSCYNAHLVFTSENLVNPLYKPKTLGELKALMNHTGINPSPVSLRPGIPENNELVDAIDAPAVMIGGDVFENMRETARLTDEMKRAEDDFERSKPQPKQPDALPE